MRLAHCYRLPLLVMVLLLSTLVATPAPAQQAFEGTSEVTLVEVPVEVSVGDEPVRGLTLDDFEIYEGKKKRPIVAFEVIDLERVEVADRAGATPLAEPVPLATAARRHFLFLFDLSNAVPVSVIKAQEAALEVLDEGLHPTDLVGVAVYANTGARMILGFTSDRGQARVALESLGLPQLVDRTPDPLGLTLGQARVQALELEGGLQSSAPSGTNAAGENLRAAVNRILVKELNASLAAQNRIQDASRRERVIDLTRSFTAMARLLGQVDARKFVLLFSEGFDSRLMLAQGTDENTNESLQSGEIWDVDSDKVFGSSRAQNHLQEMVEEFRRSGAVVHAVDIGRLRGGVDVALDRSGIGAGQIQGGDAPSAPGSGPVGEDSLFMIADGTGGSLYRNFNDLGEAVGRVLSRSSVTYLLAFEPKENPRDGSYHPIRIKVKGLPARAAVVHRDGFYSNPPILYQSQLEQKLRMAEMILGKGEGGPVPVRLATTALPMPLAQAGSREDGDRQLVPYLLEVDGRELLAGHGDALLTADIHLYAFDGEGSVAAFQSQVVSFNLLKTRKTLEDSGIRFYGDLELPPGRYSLRVLVRNQKSGAFGLTSQRVDVPALGENRGEARAGTARAALFVEDPGRWVMLREKGGELLAPYPFMLGDRLLVPVTNPTLAPASQVRLWVSSVESGVGADATAPSGWSLRVTTAQGKEVRTGALTVLEREADPTSGGERVLATFDAAGLAVGDYLLHLSPGPAEPLPFRVGL